MAESAAHIYCMPRVDYTIQHHKINGKTILEIVIPESVSKPHKAPWKENSWKAFVRVGDQNFIANVVLLEVWKLKHQDKKLLVRYNKLEEALFNLIRKQGKITLNQFVNNCRIKRYLAVKILAQLVAIKAIDMIITEKLTYFTILED